MRMYLGTYSVPILFGTGEVFKGKGEGIHPYAFDPQTGELKPEGKAVPAENPSFLAASKDGRFLYAVNELKEFDGEFGGALSAYAVAQDGTLTLLSQRATRGTDPCHVAVEEQGRCVVAANYSSGSVCGYAVGMDGSLDEKGTFAAHAGCGPNAARQEGPHAHSVVFTPDMTALAVCDLGIDQLMLYPVNPLSGMPDWQAGRGFALTPGSGPRACVFSKAGDRCYVVCELSCEVWTLAYEDGTFTSMQHISTIEPGAVQTLAADIHLSHDGRFLYVSNRGEDSIAVFCVRADGTLSYLQTVSSHGRTPRQFALDPTGRWLLAGNQDSDSIAVFKRCEATGALFFSHEIAAPTPVCICFP